MKKVFVSFLFAIMFVVGAVAQTTSATVVDGNYFVLVEKNEMIDYNDSTTTFTFDLTGKSGDYLYAVSVLLTGSADDYGTTPLLNGYSQYSYDGYSYTNVDTITFYATQADTTLFYSSLSTAVMYPFFRISLVGQDSVVATIDKVIGRFAYDK